MTQETGQPADNHAMTDGGHVYAGNQIRVMKDWRQVRQAR
jgi:hypothetical protein